jgi:hypothetical protein
MVHWRYNSTIPDLGIRWSDLFTPRPLYPQGKDPPGIHWIGNWAGPRGGLNAME